MQFNPDLIKWADDVLSEATDDQLDLKPPKELMNTYLFQLKLAKSDED